MCTYYQAKQTSVIFFFFLRLESLARIFLGKAFKEIEAVVIEFLKFYYPYDDL